MPFSWPDALQDLFYTVVIRRLASAQISPGNILWLLLQMLATERRSCKSSLSSHCTDLFELFLTRRHVSTTAKKHHKNEHMCKTTCLIPIIIDVLGTLIKVPIAICMDESPTTYGSKHLVTILIQLSNGRKYTSFFYKSAKIHPRILFRNLNQN